MKILGTGSAMPERVVTNQELSSFLDTSDEWIATRTGIRERRVLSCETLPDLAARAAKSALDDAGLSAGEIDYILCANVINPFMTPGLGCIVQGMIGANCPALDLNAACVGFIYALQVAQGLLLMGNRRILIVCAEQNSALADWSDRSTCVLFGDGAAAVVVEQSSRPTLFKMGTQARADVLYALHDSGTNPYLTQKNDKQYLTMNGQEVYKFAVSAAFADINALLEEGGLQKQDIRYYILHQANLRIVRSVQARMKLPEEAFPSNIANYGNTSSVSIPLLIDELSRAGKLHPGDPLILSAFGAGLTTGACLLHWSR